MLLEQKKFVSLSSPAPCNSKYIFINALEEKSVSFLLKGSDRQCMVVELRM